MVMEEKVEEKVRASELESSMGLHPHGKLLSSYLGLGFSLFLALLPSSSSISQLSTLHLKLLQAEQELYQLKSRRKEDSKANAIDWNSYNPNPKKSIQSLENQAITTLFSIIVVIKNTPIYQLGNCQWTNLILNRWRNSIQIKIGFWVLPCMLGFGWFYKNQIWRKIKFKFKINKLFLHHVSILFF